MVYPCTKFVSELASAKGFSRAVRYHFFSVGICHACCFVSPSPLSIWVIYKLAALPQHGQLATLVCRWPLQLQCITAVTSSRGSALTLARATAATLQSLTLSRATASTLCSLPHVEVGLLAHVPLHLHCVHCLTWQYSVTYHCTYSGSARTLARATAAAVHHCSHFFTRQCSCIASIQSLPHVAVHLLSQVPLQLHCITAGTSSRGSALTLARATAATLQSLPLSRATASTLCSLPHVAVHLLSQGHCICTLPLGAAHYFSLYIYTKCKPCFWWPAGHFFEKKNSEKKICSEYVFFAILSK